jgi:hypothetical protein
MPPAEPVIKLREQIYRGAETVNVGNTDARPVGYLAIWLSAPID